MKAEDVILKIGGALLLAVLLWVGQSLYQVSLQVATMVANQMSVIERVKKLETLIIDETSNKYTITDAKRDYDGHEKSLQYLREQIKELEDQIDELEESKHQHPWKPQVPYDFDNRRDFDREFP